MAAKNCFDMTIHVCHCGVVVKELLARVDKPGSTPGDAVFSFFIPFFFWLADLFKHYFSFWPFFLYSYCWPCWSCTWINIYFKRKSGVSGKGISKARSDLHTGQPYDQKKTISCQDMSLLWNSWIFSMLVDIMTNNTQYTTNCTSLHHSIHPWQTPEEQVLDQMHQLWSRIGLSD